MRILLVEDHDMLRQMYSQILTIGGGHTVVPVSDGQEAWNLIEKRESFDQIISDNLMSDMHGVELLRKVRANASTASTPFTLMSTGNFVSPNDPTPLTDVCRRYHARFLSKYDVHTFEDLIST